jgi:hypothetical protein
VYNQSDLTYALSSRARTTHNYLIIECAGGMATMAQGAKALMERPADPGYAIIELAPLEVERQQK